MKIVVTLKSGNIVEVDDIFNRHYSISDYCDEIEVGSFTYKYVHEGCFLTEKACREHIEKNHYHYSKDAVPYCTHAWRNPEMELIIELLEKFK